MLLEYYRTQKLPNNPHLGTCMKQKLLVLFILFFQVASQAQDSGSSTASNLSPLEKYNGYGLPNSKFMKVSQNKTDDSAASENKKNVKPTQKKLEKKQDGNEDEFLSASSQRSNSNLIRKDTVSKKEDSPFKFFLEVDISYSIMLDKKNEDGTHPEYGGVGFAPAFKFYDYKISGLFNYNYDLHQPDIGNDWDDGQFSLSRKGWELGSYFKIGPTATLDLPFSKESRVNRTMKYILSGGFNLALNSKNAGVENVTLSYAASYGYFSNEYTTRADGITPTSKYRYLQILTTGYKIGAVDLLGMFYYTSNYSYDDVVRNSFKHIESISYTFPNKIILSIMHVNKGPMMKAKTYENNLEFYDKETSTLVLDLATAF